MIGTENHTGESTKTLHLIFTLGVPGIGKSSLINTLRRASQAIPKMAVEVLTADEVRSAILAQEYQARSLQVENLSQEEIFKIEVESAPKIKTAFNEEVSNRLQKLSKVGSPLSLFFLDKNYCSASLVNHVNDEASKFFTGYNIERTLMVPDVLSGDLDSQKIVGPFRFETILVSLVRGLNRKNHITMNHGCRHVLLSFTGCLGSQLSESLESKFPKNQYRQLEVDYYSKDVAKEFLAAFPKQDQLERLRSVLMDVATKKTQIQDVEDYICGITSELVPMSTFKNLTEENAKEYLIAHFVSNRL